MALGGCLSLSDRRYRIAGAKRPIFVPNAKAVEE